MKPETAHRIGRIVNRVSDYIPPGQAAALREIIEHELRGQDCDTRHACADAVMNLPHDMTHTDAQRACINAQAV